jgi:hypothetical protein
MQRIKNHLLKTSIEVNIDEDNKNVTLNHPLYDDELECTKKKTFITYQSNKMT